MKLFTLLLLLGSLMSTVSAVELAGIPVEAQGVFTANGMAQGRGEMPPVTDAIMDPIVLQVRVAGTFVQAGTTRFTVDRVHRMENGVLLVSLMGQRSEVLLLGNFPQCRGNPPGLVVIDESDNSWMAVRMSRGVQ